MSIKPVPFEQSPEFTRNVEAVFFGMDAAEPEQDEMEEFFERQQQRDLRQRKVRKMKLHAGE